MTADTKYPVLLVHGMGFRDRKHLCYWGRTAKLLKKNGTELYFGGQDGCGSVESNAKQLENGLKEALSLSGAEKVNIIAHSKGGLEARYLISTMGYGDKIASLTTLSTPHNGSITVDKLLRFPEPFVKFSCGALDIWFRILGDKKPDVYSAINLFKTSSANKFNEENPDDERVYYQSYAFVMRKMFDDFALWITWLVVHHFEGDNDGLLAPRATKWTNFRGVYEGVKRRGISHCDEVDMRRTGFPVKNGDIRFDDITGLYLNIVKELKEKGY